MARDLEHRLQCTCVRWFRLQYPRLIWNLFSIPNGGHRNIRVAQKLKKEGVVSGVSDLFLAIPSGNSAGLFLELKIKPNRPTKNQITFARKMMESGYHVEFIYSFEKFQSVVNDWVKNERR